MMDKCEHKDRRPFCPWYYNVSWHHGCSSPNATCPEFACLHAIVYERQRQTRNDRPDATPYHPDDARPQPAQVH